MNSQKVIGFLLAIILFAGCSSGHSQSEKRIQNYFGTELPIVELDKFLEFKLDSLNIPGLSFALINNGLVVHRRTLGYANMKEASAVNDKTLFEGASISKSVFAFLVMTYVEEGKLDLDKPLHEYLPYPDITNDDRYKKITARMVLSHRSGFPNWRFNEMDGKLKIYFEPGTDYLYSGEGYQYLAMVLREIEKTDWKGLETAFQERIAKPLDLEHTVFIPSPYTREHKATPYDENSMPLNMQQNDEFGAAYSIHTEPGDFSNWMIAVMNGEILSKESYNELFKRHSPVPSGGNFDLFYTLGFFTPDVPDTDIYLHSGNNEGFTCMYLLDPEKDWGFSVFTNSEYGQELGNQLGDFLIPVPE